jgi:serine/threonine protein kinase
VPDIRLKYSQISKCIKQLRSPFFETFEYIDSGIRVSGREQPIIKMGWVKGETLGTWIENNHKNRSRIQSLAKSFREAVSFLSANGVAHGDLQHGNLIIDANGAVKLIDYDGMFVPGMAQGNGHEIGHPNFQHPERSAKHFGPSTDRFSAIAIYLALEIIEELPNLADKYFNGDNILFTKSDFDDPSSSPIFRELVASSPNLRAKAENFISCCSAPIAQTPSLEDFIAGRNIPAIKVQRVVASQPIPVAPQPQRPQSARNNQYPIIDASQRTEILKRDGQQIEVIGTVSNVKHFESDRGGPGWFIINFGDHWTGNFSVPVYRSIIPDLQARYGQDLRRLRGVRVSVFGNVQVYNRADNTRVPQINPESARSIVELPVLAPQPSLPAAVQQPPQAWGVPAQPQSAAARLGSNQQILAAVKSGATGGMGHPVQFGMTANSTSTAPRPIINSAPASNQSAVGTRNPPQSQNQSILAKLNASAGPPSTGRTHAFGPSPGTSPGISTRATSSQPSTSAQIQQTSHRPPAPQPPVRTTRGCLSIFLLGVAGWFVALALLRTLVAS